MHTRMNTFMHKLMSSLITILRPIKSLRDWRTVVARRYNKHILWLFKTSNNCLQNEFSRYKF